MVGLYARLGRKVGLRFRGQGWLFRGWGLLRLLGLKVSSCLMFGCSHLGPKVWDGEHGQGQER